MTLKTNMRGFQQYLKAHPRKSCGGYFSLDGKPLTDRQIRRLVDYAVEHGYEAEADVPDEEIKNVLEL